MSPRQFMGLLVSICGLGLFAWATAYASVSTGTEFWAALLTAWMGLGLMATSILSAILSPLKEIDEPVEPQRNPATTVVIHCPCGHSNVIDKRRRPGLVHCKKCDRYFFFDAYA